MDHLEHIVDQVFVDSPIRAQEGAMVYLRRRLLNAFMLALGDALALSIALMIAGSLRMWWLGELVIPYWSWYLLPIWWGGAWMMRLLPSWGLGPIEELRRITVLLFAVYGATAAAIFLSQQGFATSRLTLSTALVLSLFTLPLTRLRIKRILIGMDRWGVPTVVYGAGNTGRHVLRLLKQEGGLGYNPVGVLDDRIGYRETEVEGVRVITSAQEACKKAAVAVLAMPGIQRSRLVELLDGPLSCYRTVMIIPDLFEVPSLWVRPRDLNGILGLEITSNLASPISQFVKRSFDIAMVVLFAAFWVPICLVVGLLIKLQDGGSPIFKQARVGRDGRVFDAWKFRTMVTNAEQVLEESLAADPTLREEWETTYKLKVDPRVTRLGHFLRRFSIDELPQLVNVLRGEMSLVGPRPLPRYHHEELNIRVRELRERIRPGITGLWQVSGRSDTGTEGIERWDAYYVRNWSLWFDAVVLIRTSRAVLRGTGAY